MRYSLLQISRPRTFRPISPIQTAAIRRRNADRWSAVVQDFEAAIQFPPDGAYHEFLPGRQAVLQAIQSMRKRLASSSPLMPPRIVAWDHVSWPGNDFFAGVRCTDDGVKAAATDSVFELTGFKGHYDSRSGAYLPPESYQTWGEVVERNGLRL